MARQGLAPWRGSHALRLALNGTATANIQENTGFDTSLAGTINIWFSVCVGADVTLGDGDNVILFALQSTGPTNEVVVGLRRSGSAYQLFAGRNAATNTLTITRSNKTWHQVELTCTIAGGTGTIDFYVDGGTVGSQITGLTQGAIIQGQLGAISGTAAGDSGAILIGGIIAAAARVYPRTQFPEDSVWVTRDITAFVGPCDIDDVVVTGTSTDAAITILDTDIYSSTGVGFSREPVVYFRNVTANDNSPGLSTPVRVKRGAYIQLTGTNPQAWVSIESDDCRSSVVKSHANYVDRGLKRTGLV